MAVLLVVSFSKCKAKDSIFLNQDLSVAMRNTPYDSKKFAVIKIYETKKNEFLRSSDISRLSPIAMLVTQNEISDFLEIMSNGRTFSNDPVMKNFHYLPAIYHIVAFDKSMHNYGYLKCQLSSDIAKPIVARIQAPDGTNSFEYRKLIPEFIEEAIAKAENLKIK